MAQPIISIGHQKRKDRGNLGTRSNENPDERHRALTKTGLLSVETSLLKKLEDNHKSKPERRRILHPGLLHWDAEHSPILNHLPLRLPLIVVLQLLEAHLH